MSVRLNNSCSVCMANITVLVRLRKLTRSRSIVAGRCGRGEDDKRVLEDMQDSEEECRAEGDCHVTAAVRGGPSLLYQVCWERRLLQCLESQAKMLAKNKKHFPTVGSGLLLEAVSRLAIGRLATPPYRILYRKLRNEKLEFARPFTTSSVFKREVKIPMWMNGYRNVVYIYNRVLFNSKRRDFYHL